MGFFKPYRSVLVFIAAALVFAAFVIWLNSGMNQLLSAARLRSLDSVENKWSDYRPSFGYDAQWRKSGNAGNAVYERARVKSVVSQDVVTDTTWNSGRQLGLQELKIELLTGPRKGQEMTVKNSLLLLGNVYVKEGDEFIARVMEDTAAGTCTVEAFAYHRAPALFGLIGLFFLLLVIIGGKKGAKSLAGLLFTLVCVFYVFMPMIFKGISPMWAAIFITVLSVLVTSLLTGGWNRKSAATIIGTVAGVAAAGVLAYFAAYLSKLTIFNTADSGALVFLAYDIPIPIREVLFAGVIIVALGAVMDVAMTVSSAVHEIHHVANIVSRRQLFRSGMNIGRDIVGTMSNTLILAYAGSSVNVLVLLYAYNQPLFRLLNFDMLAIPVLQSVAGSIGVILTIPITAAVSSVLISSKHKGGRRV